MGLLKRALSFFPIMAMFSQQDNIHKVSYDPKVDFNRGNHSKRRKPPRTYSMMLEDASRYRRRRANRNENGHFATTKGFALGDYSNPASICNLK